MSRWIAFLLVVLFNVPLATAEPPKRVEHTVAANYHAELSSFTDGTTSTGTAAIAGELGYQASVLNPKGQPTFSIEAGAALTVGQMVGTISATQAHARGHLRLGPATVSPEENRGTMAWFPFTFELDTDGDVAALPRLSARPDQNRALFNRGQVSGATRVLRVEIGDSESEPDDPISSALDFVTLFGDVEITSQDGTRIEGGAGTALMSVTDHYTRGQRLDVFAFEQRWSKLPDGASVSIATLWMLKADLVNPATGTNYTIGWGVALGGPYDELAVPTDDNPTPELSIGGLGFWFDKSWGGYGVQYLREPYVTMAGEPALDDRAWIEAWRGGKLRLSARSFVAHTRRARDGEWLSDWSAGVEVGAHRDVRGITVDLTLEAGQTHYAAIDGGRPQVGFATRGQLSLRRSGQRSWSR